MSRSMGARWVGLCLAAGLVCLLGAGVWWAAGRGDAGPAAPTPTTAGPAQGAPALSDPARVARGAYLARVGNCAGCHTAPGGAPMAGGRRLQTPYGAVYAGNLTPDPATGLGRWRADDFHRAMHDGRGRDGRRLVPAFPYTSFTQVAREDNDALFAYLRSLPAVVQPAQPHELRFPYGTQVALALWQGLNFRPAAALEHAPTSGLARGAYLVRGLGHCGECHAPRNRWAAPSGGLDGGDMPGERWHAPSLHPQAGAADDDVAQTVALLRDGRNDRRSTLGPMALVVQGSTQHWQAADLAWAVHYLHSLPPQPVPPAAPAANPTQLSAGARLYVERCADCHGRDGAGVPGVYPALAGNPVVTQASLRNLVQVLRHGGFAPSTVGNPRPYGMPPSDLPNEDIAAVLTYLRQSWQHQAAAVSTLDVMQAR